ncbi:diacylglycerol kinase eta isoform X1 [Ooceraea biroi]|uniref:diacylglycerol kinase eta isoform X1 n=1 Tax=Ooceraea biroi TaxID=2015173 RepID=UPI000F073590|nr:diacylglycerol kinase eta isoform X1 [Ooceraea biroi]XP_011351825.2 diacylglycerol kinase eta isoform X1 [Ooceraea biroi]XP_011351826.2 diacylglycerol kinase eta isoform X1 [Ooceraea biroi]XP_011351827.2 diacylglycerol kinase eta isoform X1 [Ooceraea biroi]XP_011351828.2 diacylglycerol kinase eta isoform X1 [Ooceraea biroi]
MEECLNTLRMEMESPALGIPGAADLLGGNHQWDTTNHTRPTYCNVCKDALHGVTSHGLSCEVCKYKVHKRCYLKALNNCKWTTLASIGKDIIEDQDGNITMPHQWMEGNLPVSSKCSVCEKTCGSVLRLQDWRCLWCRATIHTACRPAISIRCPLGSVKLSVVPPTALHSIGSDEAWEAVRPTGCSPLLVFVNSKSGDNQGFKFLRRFKQILNPAQVFDLMKGGPGPGLRLFRHFDPFRILVCSGDGSIGWVLSEIDRLGMHNQCRVGVLPLGTGNDLSRVLGWGSSCDDDTHLPQLLERYEKASIKMLDRWSIMTFERGISLSCHRMTLHRSDSILKAHQYEDSVLAHITNILQSDQESVVICSAKVLCETIKDFATHILDASLNTGDQQLGEKCEVLQQKLDLLLEILLSKEEKRKNEESCLAANAADKTVDVDALKTETLSNIQEAVEKPEKELTNLQSLNRRKSYVERDTVISRANSLKRAFKRLVEHRDSLVDEQNPLDEKQDVKTSNIHHISIMSDDTPINNMTNRVDNINLMPPAEPGSNIEISPCPSPISNVVFSIPVPDIRRDSQPEELLTLPAPDGFADSRRNSENIPQGIFETSVAQSNTENQQEVLVISNEDFPSPESAQVEGAPSDTPITQISVIIEPPSPSLSIESHQKLNLNYKLDHVYNPYDARWLNPNLDPHDKLYCKSSSTERLSVELPEPGFSPQATRRISSGSLLKASEVVSLASAARADSSNINFRSERAKSIDKTEGVKKLPIINPLVRLPMWPNVSGGAGLISQALLANADTLCAAVSPLMDPDESSMEGYTERCVMNNYFGIGIDAKITLEFHNKREEHPEKFRSRAKNYMWYGVLGSKEWLQKSYKNLEQRVQLECDGQRIPLPSLQGIVVLNIPSFMGGTNFWGRTKEGDIFLEPSFDDRVLEVVAVFGPAQMAASRVINLQHHRIAQCQTVQITILGEEGVPVQVDGEAWVQTPGIIRIVHKNRMQMLYRNRALETSLRAWEEKQRNTISAVTQSTSTLSNTSQSQSRAQLQACSKSPQLNDEELNILFSFIEAVTTLVKWVKLLIISDPSLEIDLYQVASRTANALEQVHPDGKILQGMSLRPMVTELVSSARQLYEESCELLRDKAHNLKLRDNLENKLSMSLASMEQELRKCTFDEGGTGLVYLQNVPTDDQGDKKNRHRGLFWLKFRRPAGHAGVGHAMRDQIATWSVQEVCTWLENLQLEEYAEKFASHDIRGRELLALTRRDLKELGITKVGHVKRILQAIDDLNH